MANKTIKDNRKSSLIQWLVFLSRLIVGGTFVFSGFVKVIDPYGTVYKFQDYFSAFHLDFLSSFAMLFSVALSVIEFVLGVHLLFGSYRKSTPRLIFIFLCVMTPVTLYLAIANPISDCGCFGDAVHLSNWATFFKNVLLLIIVLFLVYRNTSLRALYNQQVQWLTGLYSLLFVFFFVYIGTYYQPYLDFRPYKIGVNIPEALAVEEPEREFVFIYEKNGERKEFLLDNLPSEEEGWVFVDRYEKTVSGQESVTPIIEDFTIYRGATDITEDIIYDENYRILLLSPDLETADDSEVDRINELYDYCVEHGYEFACVTASTPQGVEAWQENTGAEYPFYFMDKTVIRTIARGNPCVLLLKGGTILRKTSPSQLPDETLLVQPLDKLTYGQPEIYRPERRIWFIVLLYAMPMLFLLLTEKTVAMIIGRVRQWRDAHRRKKKENENDMIEKDYSEFVKINIADDDERGVPFSQEELDILWKHSDLADVRMILIMIYSGYRIKAFETININFEQNYFQGGVKTAAGKDRIVPIHPCILPFVEEFSHLHFTAINFRAKHFYPALKSLGISMSVENTKHTPHDCRHTFSWLCDKYKVDDLSKHLMMGHTLGKDIEKSIYGHRTLDELRAEINKIQV